MRGLLKVIWLCLCPCCVGVHLCFSCASGCMLLLLQTDPSHLPLIPHSHTHTFPFKWSVEVLVSRLKCLRNSESSARECSKNVCVCTSICICRFNATPGLVVVSVWQKTLETYLCDLHKPLTLPLTWLLCLMFFSFFLVFCPCKGRCSAEAGQWAYWPTAL